MKTQDNRRRKALQNSIALEMERAALGELQVLWKELRRKLVRLHRLKKYQMYTPDTYAVFEKRLHDRLMDILQDGMITILDLEYALMEIETGTFEYLPDVIMRAIEPNLATMITRTSESVKRSVAMRVTQWYKTPGQNLQSIIDDLKPRFGLSRAHLIAQTEITDMNSQIQINVARTLEIKQWWWQTRRDQIVCDKPIHSPDGNVYAGCHELHGKVFDVDGAMPMPPHGSHLNCRCDAVLIREKVAKKMIKVIYPEIAKAEFVEGEHPRASDGRFGDKAGATAGTPKPPKMLAGLGKPPAGKPVEPPKIEPPVVSPPEEPKLISAAPVTSEAKRAKSDEIYTKVIGKSVRKGRHKKRKIIKEP